MALRNEAGSIRKQKKQRRALLSPTLLLHHCINCLMLLFLFTLEEVLDAADATHHITCLEGQIDGLGGGT